MAFGLRPIRKLGGGTWKGNVVTCVAGSDYATDLFIGDPVIATSTGGAQIGITTNYTALGAGGAAEDGGYYPVVNLATAGTTSRVYGIIVGFEPSRNDLTLVYGKASTVRLIRVALADADTVFEATEDGVGGYMALTNIGNTVSLVSGTGSATTGYSGWMLDSSTATTTTLQCLIVGLSNRLGNAAGSTSTVWEVVVAQPQVALTQLGAGV